MSVRTLAHSYAPGTTAFVSVNLKTGTDKGPIVNSFMQRYAARVLYSMSSSTITDYLFFMVWSPTNMEHDELLKDLASDPAVEKVTAHILQRGYYSQTWLDRLPEERAMEKP